MLPPAGPHGYLAVNLTVGMGEYYPPGYHRYFSWSTKPLIYLGIYSFIHSRISVYALCEISTDCASRKRVT